MFDRATMQELTRLSGFVNADDSNIRAAARAAMEAILRDHGVTLGEHRKWVEIATRPLRALQGPSVWLPPRVRPGGEWIAFPHCDGRTSYATLFQNGVTGSVVLMPRCRGATAWTGRIDRESLSRANGEMARFACAEQAVFAVERVAQRLFQHPDFRIATGPTGAICVTLPPFDIDLVEHLSQ